MARRGNQDLRIMLLGDSGVGKTCSIIRFFNNSFSDIYPSTLGIDFKIKNVKINDKIISVKIWDTAGQERFRTLTLSYLRGADLFILYYDITQLDTFEKLEHWVKSIRAHSNESTPIIIVGTKMDAVERRKVNYEDAEKVCKENSIHYYYEISGKTGENIEKTFYDAIKIALKIPISSKIKDVDSDKEQNNNCCSIS